MFLKEKEKMENTSLLLANIKHHTAVDAAPDPSG